MDLPADPFNSMVARDSSTYLYAGAMNDMKEILAKVQWKFIDSTSTEEWVRVYAMNGHPVMRGQMVMQKRMPDVRGMGLKDALYLLENMQVKVITKGRGKVKAQSIEPGMPLAGNPQVEIELN